MSKIAAVYLRHSFPLTAVSHVDSCAYNIIQTRAERIKACRNFVKNINRLSTDIIKPYTSIGTMRGCSATNEYAIATTFDIFASRFSQMTLSQRAKYVKL